MSYWTRIICPQCGVPIAWCRCKKSNVIQMTGRCSECRKVQDLCPHFAPPGEIPAAERLNCQHFKVKDREDSK